MVKRLKLFDVICVIIPLLFVVTISYYHISYDGYLGLSSKQWGIDWALSENCLLLFTVVIIGYLSKKIVRWIYWGLLAPLFFIKLIYHLSCYSGLILLTPDIWEEFWSMVCFIFEYFALFVLSMVVIVKLSQKS
jgi:hypothetical protein